MKRKRDFEIITDNNKNHKKVKLEKEINIPPIAGEYLTVRTEDGETIVETKQVGEKSRFSCQVVDFNE